jgi:hypothetical protein
MKAIIKLFSELWQFFFTKPRGEEGCPVLREHEEYCAGNLRVGGRVLQHKGTIKFQM